MKNIKYITILYSSLIVAIIVSFGACKQNKEIVPDDDGTAMFVFSVSGIQSSSAGTVHNKIASMSPEHKNLDNETVEQIKLKNNITINYNSNQSDIATLFGSSQNKGPSKIGSKVATNTLMKNTTRYRILIYNKTKDIIERNIETTAENNLEIPVTLGNEYKWYAYSYNSEDHLEEPTIDNNVPFINTFADKDFLWASSGTTGISPTGQRMPITILFEHKVAEVVLQIDTKHLYGEITSLNLQFGEEDYFNTGTINLETGALSNVTSYASPILDRTKFTLLPGDSTILKTHLYTADPSNIATFKVVLKQLTTKQNNGTVNELLKTTDSAIEVPFNFTNPTVAKSLVSNLAITYRIPTKRILHVTGPEHNDDLKMALAAQPATRDLSGTWSALPAANRAPFNMINEQKNYGPLLNSVVQTDGFTHERVYQPGTLSGKLTASGQIPDIVIIAINYVLTPLDITNLKQYLDNGGVVIMFTATNGLSGELTSIQSLMRTVFNNNNINVISNTYRNGGNLFKIDYQQNINDMIVNGPFGDLRGKYWGNDYREVVQFENIPATLVTSYSDPSAANSNTKSTALSMFKHNTKQLFWIGNGSFLSGANWYSSAGWSNKSNQEPFATVNLPSQPNPNAKFNYNYYPIPKTYGNNFNNIGFSYSTLEYNAPFFANLMAWALYQSEFFGINNLNK